MFKQQQQQHLAWCNHIVEPASAALRQWLLRRVD
jgi:hypothetical protein